ncbi:hypothetical protein CEP54_003157 [Fusarium duplospermum]|uniref:Uncharacterized protein n=1 Tax=Fusarium duplospermum TaxID=1325734 RepID=A0A428QRA8_9HYPO|nr:hypothetical protein CEP54_003157 [Fusarium duplospermum]
MMSEEYYNSWEEPSEYPRIPNVYEPIPGVPSRNAHNVHNVHNVHNANNIHNAHNTNTQPLNQDETKAIAIKFNIGNRRQSTSLGQPPDLENWSDQRPLEEDQANWSVAGQLATSFPWSHDSFGCYSNPPNPPQSETDEQRQAKRQSSFEKWMNAGDRIFCHSHKTATHTRPGYEALRAS